jgi:predicted membrane-bound spermidine synthase
VGVLLVLFLLSGFAALLYQIVWQRALFAFYGIDITSATIVVTAFMLGLGVGSLVGGLLSKRAGDKVLPLFAAFELGIALFGFFSLEVFAGVAAETLHLPRLAMGLVAFLLVLIPTTCMGATLPLLVEHATRRSGNVGRSVGVLYFVNTLGAALGSFAAVGFLLGLLGQSATARSAAVLNLLLAIAVMVLHRAAKRVP